jgi:hypothetical protein
MDPCQECVRKLKDLESIGVVPSGVLGRCALWTERHLHLSLGSLPEQKPFHPTPIHNSFESRPARGDAFFVWQGISGSPQ